MVNMKAKFALKGLPISTDCDIVQIAFQDENLNVTHIRQMTKTSIENGIASQIPIPVWVLTHTNPPKQEQSS